MRTAAADIGSCSEGKEAMRHSLCAKIAGALILGAALLGAPAGAAETAGKRVSVTGEVIDSWCYITEIMFAIVHWLRMKIHLPIHTYPEAVYVARMIHESYK